ncbi:MAG: helix-turn-helix transcriptional regulator [Treponema sp.]|nr:helix-turn-helix transcriptional regulator [Treponema sp.]
MNLGNNLRDFRKKNNFTQKQISEKLGIPLTTWASWESDKSQPKLEILVILRGMGLEIPGLTNNEPTDVPQAVTDNRLNELSEKRRANTVAAITMLENAALSIQSAVKLLKESIGE